jgi:hypothetical protein
MFEMGSGDGKKPIFEIREVSNAGANNPIVARLAVQSTELAEAIDLSPMAHPFERRVRSPLSLPPTLDQLG